MTVIRHIEEHVVEDHRLGRHVEHDPRSREFAFGVAIPMTDLKDVKHVRTGGVFNQGNLGSCTGNATAGACNTQPLHRKGEKLLKEKDAVDIYSLATSLDNISGSYPPNDTGSSGLAAAKAAKKHGLISGYKHAFTMEEVLTALQIGPVIAGIDWYEGFDNPDAKTGLVQIAGQVRGGHEIEAFEFQHDPADLGSSLIGFYNSWGTSWGLHGKFYMAVSTLSTLLAQQGDVTILDALS